MSLFSPLPTPPEDWLHKKNELYGGQDMSPGERPFRALGDWAAEHGQPLELLSQLGGAAWKAIDGFFRTNTKLGHGRIQPLRRSVWFYQGSFYQINLFVIAGGTGPSTVFNPLQCLAENMPNSLLHEFSRDEPKVLAYEEHLSNASDSLACSAGIIRDLKEPLAREFLSAAETLLDSAVTDLLDAPPNTQAASHCRVAFEASLKALSAEKGGLTRSGSIKIRHRLQQLVAPIVACCGQLISDADLTRLTNAAMDSISPAGTRRFFPDVGARYDIATLPRQRRLWDCYATAQHAFATVLRAFGASDSRRQI